MTKYVVDTSVIMNQRISKCILDGTIELSSEIIIPQVVIAEIENRANSGHMLGYLAIKELNTIRQLSKEGKITLTIVGERPSLEQVKLASGGELDSVIREFAKNEDTILITSDKIQAEIAKFQDINVKFIKEEKSYPKLDIKDLFTPETMSVHLKESVPPMAKIGTPGAWKLVQIRDEPISLQALEELIRVITEKAKSAKNSFLEIEYKGAIVVQIEDLRITITQPPFSDSTEITVIKPIKRMTIYDYNLPNSMLDRFNSFAEGVLICGPPGSGKSTFAGALATFYEEQKKIVKTMENPRDLQVPNTVTQYAPLERDLEKTADIILLVRPDFTIFDEIRKGKDFSIFADMRLAGIGMVGVIHATSPIDAIQRMLINRKIELGMIPQIVDTIIFIDGGIIRDILYLKITVRVPKGMYELDLARPIIEVYDFYTDTIAYEIYTYGDNIVVIPLAKKRKASKDRVISEMLRKELQKIIGDSKCEIEPISDHKVRVYVDKSSKPLLIGKNGANIINLENKLGFNIDVRQFSSEGADIESRRRTIPFNFKITKKYIVFEVDTHPNRTIQIEYNGKKITNTKSNTQGIIQIKKTSKAGKTILAMFKNQDLFELTLL